MSIHQKYNVHKRFLGIVSIFIFLPFANSFAEGLINTSHLDHLYEQINVNGNKLGIIHIYSEYPDYKWIGDEDEGITCVDDVARAAIFYIEHYKLYHSKASYKKAKSLIRFVIYMQAENGFFYNFIFPDYSINKTFKTSVAEPNWWSWRALWCLAEAKNIFKEDKNLNKKIDKAIDKTLDSAKKWFSTKTRVVNYNGFELPSWLPFETAADQSALIIKALCIYYKKRNDNSILPIIKKLSDGIMMMQAGDKDNFPYGCFLSWQNTWHGWGNSQSEALLLASEILRDDKYSTAALNEIKYFYPYLIRENYISNFELNKDESKKNSLVRREKFSQIAYEISPVVLSSLKAYQLFKDTLFLRTAVDAGLWFFGKNVLNKHMYDTDSGRCFDGIISETEVNKNSGAESTIEALLALIAIEKIPAASKLFTDTINCK
ncbi:MAG: hypothetical protein C4539_12495 [Ignavibacteriales bacterium]|nr:MAG: hypothetical protein C4539_12495 [Ignavibacteriales bacterium]